MAEPFRIRMANLNFDVRPLFDGVARLCADYIVPGEVADADGVGANGVASSALGAGVMAGTGEGAATAAGSACEDVPETAVSTANGAADSAIPPADFAVEITRADIEHERDLSTDEQEWSDAYLETLAVYRKIAEWLPTRQRMLMHGAVVEHDGLAYMFCAASGTGKSTHVGLWCKHLGSAVNVVNGDKPIVWVPAEASGVLPQMIAAPLDSDAPAPLVFGTPWAGKEGWQRNTSAPLAGICFLDRAPAGESSIRPLAAHDALERIMQQVYLPDQPREVMLALDLLDALLKRVPLYVLECDISEEAVRTSFETLTKTSYPS